MADNTVGTTLDIINVTITGTFTEVTYTRPVKSFNLRSRSGVPLQWKILTGDTNTYSIDAGEHIDSKVILIGSNYASSSMGFFKTVDGSTDVIEGVVTY